MKVKLLITEPRSHDKRVLFAELPVVIGRAAHTDVRLDDPWVSRCHCQIDQIGEALIVRDLESKHGTWVHGTTVNIAEVSPDDEIMVGLTKLQATLGNFSSLDPAYEPTAN